MVETDLDDDYSDFESLVLNDEQVAVAQKVLEMARSELNIPQGRGFFFLIDNETDTLKSKVYIKPVEYTEEDDAVV